MSNGYFQHPNRFPKNAHGAFYTLGDISKDGTWCGRCLSCNAPEEEAPTLLAALTDTNSDTYFLRQPETDEEIEHACNAIDVCCVDALRYGGQDPKILARLHRTGCCDYSLHDNNLKPTTSPTCEATMPQASSARKWWQLWK